MPPQQTPAPLPVQAAPTPLQAPAVKDTFGINYASLNLLGSTKGLLDNDKNAKVLVPACVIIGAIFIVYVNGLIGILFIGGAFAYIAKLSGERNKKLWTQFALDNNWHIGPATAAEYHVPPSLGGIGGSRKLSDIISGTFASHDFRLFTYTYTVGSGKNSQTYSYTILQLVLQRQLPSFIVDSLRVQGAKNIPYNYEKVSLEGDFDKTFNLYMPKGASADVLSVVSPDVMQTMITSNTTQDIESAGGYIWFIKSGDTRGHMQLPGLFAAVHPLANELAHRAKTYQVTNVQAHVSALSPAGDMGVGQGNQALAMAELKRSPVTKMVAIILIISFFVVPLGMAAMVFLIKSKSP
jgi:hypothetical protein